MPDAAILAIGLAVAGAAVLLPLWVDTPSAASPDELDAASVRHRVALESLLDVEADHRAGSLDEPAYAGQLEEAEARAAETRAALDAVSRATATAGAPAPAPAPARERGRRFAVMAAAVIGLVLVGGSLVGVTGMANATIVNQGLADAQATEAARQERIAQLLAALTSDPADEATLSDLADAYLAGSSRDDLVRAAVALRVLIDLDPQRTDAFERIITAYLRAGDYNNGRAALDSYAALDGADPAEAAFFDGLIALRGEDDPARAVEAFGTFLELAPDDPRAGMIRGLRDEARDAAAARP
jgi:hypothetical protein